MRRLNLTFYGNEVLRKKTKFVKLFGQPLIRFIGQMFDLMYESNGIGLAAPQVGVLRKIVVVDIMEEDVEPLALVNPKIIWSSEEMETFSEGCLSIPGVEGDVIRPERITVKSQYPEDGTEYILEASGLLARCIQHEIDHLNGVMFVDHLSKNDYSNVSRQLQEMSLTE